MNFGNLVPWKTTPKKDLVKINQNQKQELAPIEDSKQEIVGIKRGNLEIQIKSKAIKINGKKFDVDPRQLIRMIKHITQSIGDYKNQDNPAAEYAISALRKARADIVSALETNFKIYWELDQNTGASKFSL